MSFDILDGDEIESVFGSSSPEDNIDLEWSNNHENIHHASYNHLGTPHVSDQQSIRAILLHRPKKAKGAFEEIHAGDTIRVVQGRGKHLRLSITTPLECDWRSFNLSTFQAEPALELSAEYSIKLGNVAVSQVNPNQGRLISVLFGSNCEPGGTLQFKATADFQLIATTNTSKSIYFRVQVASYIGTILECPSVTFKTSHSQSSTAQPVTKKRRLDTGYDTIAPNLSAEPSPVHSPQSENNTNTAIVMPTSLDVHGSVRAYSFHQFSDLRLKTNIEEIVDALQMVTQLQGVRYQWKPNALPGLDHRERVLGLIAQQVQEVFPEAVQQEENGYLSVNYSDMVPVLIQAVKQLANQQKESEGDLVAMRMTLNNVIVWMSIRKKIGDYEEDENKMAAARLDRYKERQLQALNFEPSERQALVDQISELRIKIEEFDNKVKLGPMSRWHPIHCTINPTRSTKKFIIIVVVLIVVLAVTAYIVFGPKNN